MTLCPDGQGGTKMLRKAKCNSTCRQQCSDEHGEPPPLIHAVGAQSPITEQRPFLDGDPFLTVVQAAAYLNVSKSYLDKLRVYGGGPLFMRVGSRKILYRKSDLDEWATQHRYRSTSEYER